MEVPAFSATAPPTPAEVTAAGALFLFDEAGQAVRLDSLFLKSFGDLDGHKRERRTALLFIRHFYCGLCMDYNSYVASKVNVEELEREGIEIIVVGCGSWELIAPYRKLLNLPFPVYADPTKAVYVALGMTRRTLALGDHTHPPEYVKRSMFANVMVSLGRAFKFGKLNHSSGDIKQLGGEFVLDGKGKVLYSHRMESTQGHGPIKEFLEAAGHEMHE